MRRSARRPLNEVVVAATIALAGAGLTGCAGEDDDNPLAPNSPLDLPDIRGAEDLDDVYTGELDAAFAEDLPAYADAEVTLLASVADVVSERVFTVTSPTDPDVGPVLVIATHEAAEQQLAAGDQIVMAATPTVDLRPEEVAEEMKLSVDPEHLEQWDDEMYLVATILQPAEQASRGVVRGP